MPEKNERDVSLDVLSRILKDGAYNTIALSAALDGKKALGKRERAFITETTNGVLRNLTLIDYVIEQFSSKPIKKINSVALNILRLSVYEILFMSTPDYAVCSEAVNIAKSRGLQGLSGFVNGVLRNIVRKKAEIPFPDEKSEPERYLSIAFSYPKWIVEKWLGCYDYEFVKQLLKKSNEAPCVSIRVNTLKTNTETLLNALEAEGVSAQKSSLCENALLLKGSGSLKQLNCYNEGLFHVQDVASQIAVSALAPEQGELIVDLCAAPGGKSFSSAYLMKNNGKIYSRDIHAHKAGLIKEGAERLGIGIIKAETRDASLIDEQLIGRADRVIVDAPCTGLGIIRKKPDIKFNRDENDVNSLQKIQRSILAAGAEYVRKGGVLLYSTCTLTNEENTDNANWFLKNFDFEKADFMADIPEALRNDIKEGFLTLFPHIHGTDGFFIAKFKKRG